MATHALPNNRIPFNRSAIMKAAWEAYNRGYNLGVPGKYRFIRDGFASCLKRAWAAAKAEARKVHLTTITGEERREHIDALNSRRLDLLRMPFGMSITNELGRIDAELRQMAA